MRDQIHFILVPDASSARKVRRAVAERGARLDVSAGTWAALADMAGKAFLVREPEKGWDGKTAEAAKKMADAFWSKSLDVDHEGTMAEVRGMLHRLLRGSEVPWDGSCILVFEWACYCREIAKLDLSAGLEVNSMGCIWRRPCLKLPLCGG